MEMRKIRAMLEKIEGGYRKDETDQALYDISCMCEDALNEARDLRNWAKQALEAAVKAQDYLKQVGNVSATHGQLSKVVEILDRASSEYASPGPDKADLGRNIEFLDKRTEEMYHSLYNSPHV